MNAARDGGTGEMPSLRISMSDPGPDPGPPGSVSLCLHRLRSGSGRIDLLRPGLLEELRGTTAAETREDLSHTYVGPLLEVVALVAVAAAPTGMPPMDAVAEANLIFLRLVEDPAVPDPLLTLGETLQTRLGELTGGA
ncbi:MAG TPA: hypothetical protein VHV82_13325 [Sporichthyaceae bacterium]|nr:hypothetical protein [Sporichthyaceae bacterium]